MKAYTDEQIQKGILRHDNLILSHIYRQYFYKVNTFIRKNSGTEEDVNDIFQEAIIVIYRKLKENEQLFSDRSFQIYLFSVCRFYGWRVFKKEKQKKTWIPAYIC